jgi:streptomycin 6-kinase
MLLPLSFRENVTQIFGEKGRDWLDHLPGLIDSCCQHWSVKLDAPFPLSINFVAPGLRADGRPVVLKVGVPNPELISEMAALRIYDGRGVVQLLEADAYRGVMLLERVTPGGMLSDLQDDEEATRIIARMMQRIWRPLTPEQAKPFPTLERWTDAFRRLRKVYNGGCGTFPKAIFDRAEGLLHEFLATQGEIVLLHGDLHHDNILRAEREPWLVIDPKGVAGEREFEVGPLMYNPWQRILDWPDPRSILSRRLDILVEELGFERERLVGWGFVGSVLSMAWSLEDHSPQWNQIMPITDALYDLCNMTYQY